MGLQISYGANPRAVDVDARYSGMGNRFGGPGGASGLSEGIEAAFGIGQPIGYNPAMIAAGQPSVNTGNEFVGGVPAYAPQLFDAPIQQPTMFNMQPYVETFNTGWPVQMNPAYNIDNITNVDQTLMQRLFSQWLTGGTSPFGPGAPQNGNE